MGFKPAPRGGGGGGGGDSGVTIIAHCVSLPASPPGPPSPVDERRERLPSAWTTGDELRAIAANIERVRRDWRRLRRVAQVLVRGSTPPTNDTGPM